MADRKIGAEFHDWLYQYQKDKHIKLTASQFSALVSKVYLLTNKTQSKGR